MSWLKFEEKLFNRNFSSNGKQPELIEFPSSRLPDVDCEDDDDDESSDLVLTRALEIFNKYVDGVLMRRTFSDPAIELSENKKPLKEIIEDSSSSSSRLISNREYADIEVGITDGDGVCAKSEVTQLITYQAWREYIEQLKKSKLENKLMGVMSKTTLAIGVQVSGGVIANAVIIRNSPPSWAVYPVEFAVFSGLCFTLAGLTLRGRRQLFSTVMIKTGAMATASSIIISLASALHPAVAWTVAPLAFLLAAAAVVFAC